MTTKPKRRYAQLWDTLKQMKSVAIVPTLSKDPAVFKKWSKTVRKAVQKEKYLDEPFRVRYPRAELTSKLDFDTKTLRFKLDLGTILSVRDFEGLTGSKPEEGNE
jgi:hypothetical protein